MKKQVLWRSMLGLRAAAAMLMITGFLATGARSASAQRDESGIDGNTYTGVNFDWTLEWDEDLWEDPSDDNSGGSDFLTLTAVQDAPFALVTIYGVSQYNGDPEECAAGYGDDFLEGRDNISDVTEADTVDLPRAPRGQANAAYAYVFDTDSGPIDVIDYVQCQTLVEDDAVIIASVTTFEEEFDDAVANFQDLLDNLEVGDGGSTTNQDEDVTPESDEDVTPESDEDQDADAEPTRDVLLGDDEEDVTPEADADEPVADSGIDGNTYESPTYGFTVEWDDSVWTPAEDRELVDNGRNGLDRLLIEHREDDSLFSDLYVEAKEDYDGDPVDCLAGEAELLSSEDGVTDFVPLEDRRGDPVEGESDAGGQFAAFTVTIDNGEDDPFELIEHVECQTLEDGQSVVVFTLVTSPDGYEDELDLAQEVIDSLELPRGGGSSN